MKKFLSCDWGTSSFRLRLIDADKAAVLAQLFNAEGTAVFYKKWQEEGQQKQDRFSFYQSFIRDQIKKLEEELRTSLKGIVLIISGMAFSRIGMIELPFQKLPFHTDGHDLPVKTMEASADFNHPLIMVSGVCTDNDMMRGEETQLIGCAPIDGEEQLFIFPGTHSKHVKVKDSHAVDITTYMTGEVFDLLSRKSILVTNIEQNESGFTGNMVNSFEKGLRDSLHINILHSSFLVRANNLLGKIEKRENYYYLSGLIIGTELKDLPDGHKRITLVSDERMQKLYLSAFRVFGFDKIRIQHADETLIKGHCKIYKQYELQTQGFSQNQR